MWMVRGESGSLYDAFREREVAAVGWSQLAPHATPGIGRKELTAKYQELEPGSAPLTQTLSSKLTPS